MPGPSTEPKDSVEWIAPRIICIPLSCTLIILPLLLCFFDYNQVLNRRTVKHPKMLKNKGLAACVLQAASPYDCFIRMV